MQKAKMNERRTIGGDDPLSPFPLSLAVQFNAPPPPLFSCYTRFGYSHDYDINVLCAGLVYKIPGSVLTLQETTYFILAFGWLIPFFPP
jgi:hypothetical protein